MPKKPYQIKRYKVTEKPVKTIQVTIEESIKHKNLIRKLKKLKHKGGD